MALGDIYSLVLEGIGPSGQQLTNRLYYKQTGSVGDAPGTELIDSWYAAAVEEFAALLHVDVAFTEMHTRNLTQPDYGLDYSLSPAIPGELTGLCLPPQCAAVLQLGTGLIGKQNRGRNYLWPADVASQNAGQWDNTYLGLATAYGNAIITVGAGSTTYQLVILEGIDPGEPPIGINVQEATIDPIVRTQRRRVPGVGS